MSRALAVRNRYRAVRGRAELDRWYGHAGSDAAIAAKSFPFSPIGFPRRGNFIGQPQRVQDSGRIAAEIRRTIHQWRLPPVNGMHLTGQQWRGPQVPAGLFNDFQVGARFMRNIGESRACSLSRFSTTADSRMEALILRRLDGRTRGMKVCR
jgi:hypothetical protein